MVDSCCKESLLLYQTRVMPQSSMADAIWCSPLWRRKKEEPCPCFSCSDLGAAEGPVNEPQDSNEPKYPNITFKAEKPYMGMVAKLMMQKTQKHFKAKKI